jgi:hypothetical protein
MSMAEDDVKVGEHVKQLRALVTELHDLVEKSQAILAAGLPPDGITETEIVGELLSVLDGPEWRRVKETRQRVCTDCTKAIDFPDRIRGVEADVKRQREEGTANDPDPLERPAGL